MNESYNYTPQPDFDGSFNAPSSSMPNPSKPYAIASLVLGILSVFCCCCYYISGIFAILSIVFACIARKKNGGKMPTMALVGLIFAIIGLVLFLIMLAFEIYLATIPQAELEKFLYEYFEAIGVNPEEIFSETGVTP